MVLFSCIFLNKKSCIQINNTGILINNDHQFDFTDFKSIHVKNDNEKFLIKLKFAVKHDFSAILQFSSVSVRDLIKTLLLSAIQNIKTITDEEKYKSLVANKIFEQSIIERFVEKTTILKEDEDEQSLFLKAMRCNQQLVNAFCKLDISINQFFNLYSNSYFFNSKNKKNALDRILMVEKYSRTNDTLRKKEHADRINFISNMQSIEPVKEKEIQIIHKAVDFEPINSGLLGISGEDHSNSNKRPLEMNSISDSEAVGTIFKGLTKINIDLTGKPKRIIPNQIRLEFDKSDFEVARDLSKLFYKSRNTEDYKVIEEKCVEFTATFRNMVEGKYGKEACKFVERIFPTFYYNK
ncbi:hypothetical protein NUSPORA_01922 [Nucleospora cyclopteri]